MKKIIMAAALALATIAAGAKTADELRIYINPGHGSWTGNDRPMQAIGHPTYSKVGTDTTNFYESNTNLRKCFGVLDKLREMGLKYDESLNQTGERWQIGAARDMSNNIVMSHVKCGPFLDDHMTTGQYEAKYKALEAEYNAATDEAKKAELKKQMDDLYFLWKTVSVRYNRNLTDIAAEVDANNFDMFISIHSNAASGTTNYAAMLYRGYDDCSSEAGIASGFSQTCKDMASKCWPYHITNTHESWTSYSLTNPCIRGDISFYKSSSTVRGYKGYLGVLKHGVPGFLVEGYFHTYNVAMQRHMNMDVNYVEGYNYAHGIADYFGIAKEKNGTIYGIVRDEHEKYNADGYNAHPGKIDAYKPLNGAKIALMKGTEKVADYTTDDNFNGAFVFKNVEPGDYTLVIEAEGYKKIEPVAVTVKAAEVVYPTAQLEAIDYVPPTVVYVDYPDLLEGSTFLAPADIAFKQAAVDKEIAQLEGKTVKRMINWYDRLYVLAHTAEGTPEVYVIDNNTLEVVATPSVEGCEGTESPLYDIAVSADGILMGCNLELCHYGADQVNAGEVRGEQKIYRWTNNEETGLPEGAPAEWIVTTKGGNWLRGIAGLAMLYSGTMEEGKILISVRTASGVKYHFTYLTVIDGKLAATDHRNNGDVQDFLNDDVLGVHTLLISPLNAESFIVNSAKVQPRQYNLSKEQKGMFFESELAEGILSKSSAHASFFKYNGHSYMVAPDADAEGKNVGLRVLDITNGLDKATVVGTTNTAFEAAEGVAAATGRVIPKLDDMDKVTGADIELYLLRGNKLSRLTTQGEKQPQGIRAYAYGITVTPEAEAYTVAFKATADAPAANIILTPFNSDEEATVIPAGAAVKGENSISIAKADLAENTKYSVAVELVNKTIPQSGLVSESKVGETVRGGVVVITDPEEDNFGYVSYSVGKANGFYTIAPDGTEAGPFFKGDSRFNAGNQSSPFRGDERGGKAVFCDWSDKGAGYWVLDPANPTELTQLLAGTANSQGSFTYEGKIIGGGSSCVAFQGKGEGQKMYSFVEDYPTPNLAGAENKVVRYDIGTADQITSEPAKVFDAISGKLFANTNVDVETTENGFFVSQCRSEGNNAEGCPGFIYYNNEGEALLNSANVKFITSCNSGIAINNDRTLFAVCQYTKLTIASVEWAEDGTPSLTHICDIALGGSYDFSQIKFDAANNIHAYIRGVGYRVYSLFGEEPTTVVPAKAEYVIEGNESGVADITVDNNAEDAPVYYNLNGIRIDSDALSTGVYIKVVGGKATKVVVK